MQFEEHIKLIKLFDIYGNLLSKKQKQVLDAFLNSDIGESEIAELLGESRQSMHDAISKAKKQLFKFEENCKFLKKEQEFKVKLEKVKELLQNNETNKSLELIREIIKSD